MAKIIPVNGGIDVYKRVQLENIKNAKRAMADSINNRAQMTAPKDTGALRSDGRVETDGDTVAVVYGDDRVPYARIHELGGRTGINQSVNISAKHYLQKAGESAAKQGLKNWLK